MGSDHTEEYDQERTHSRNDESIAQASKKIPERKLKWHGHVMRREEEHAVRRVMTEEIPGKRKRGRPKTRWKDVCRRDMQTVGLRAAEEEDRAYWRARINNHTGDPRSLERPETTKKKKLDEVGSGEERPPTRRGNPGPGEGVIPARGRASRARGRGSRSVAVDHRFVVSRSRQA